MIEKLLSMVTAGSTLAGAGLLHRYLLALMNVMVLGIISAFMLCVVLICIFMMTYVALVFYGVDPFTAKILLGMALLIATTILVAVTNGRLKEMRALSRFGLRRDGDDWPDIGKITHTFINSFMNSNK